MTDSPFRSFAPKLHSQGYNIIPVRPNSKSPAVTDWTNIQYSPDQISKMAANGYANHSIGLLTANNPVVDIDVHDQTIVDEIAEYCLSSIGPAVERQGQHPKTALIYRSNSPLPKQTSSTWIDHNGNTNRIEVLGQGQQLVIYGIHPDTKKPYQFIDGSLDLYHNDQLTLITPDHITALFNHYDFCAELAGWTLTKPHSHSPTQTPPTPPVEEDDPFAQYELSPTQIDIDTHTIKEALMAYSREQVADYDVWINTGISLYNQYQGDSEGLRLWDKWSSRASNYRPGECAKRWRTFKTNTKTARTFASVLHETKPAREERKQKQADDTLKDWLKHLVHLVDGDQIIDLRKIPSSCTTKRHDFFAAHCNIKIKVEDKSIPLQQQWLHHKDKLKAMKEVYRPSEPRMLFERNEPLHNTFFMPGDDGSEPPIADERIIAPVLDHLRYLLPDNEQYQWFIQWMAFNIQYPQRRCKVTPLHVSLPHGTGRGWVADLLRHLVGHHNCSSTTMRELTGQGTQFNDYVDDKLLCFIEEVREKSTTYEVNDKIRGTLTEDWLEVNTKYGQKSTKQIFTNFFLMSNHQNALYIPHNDRRIYVLDGPTFIQDNEYYDRLYSWLTPSNVSHFRVYLKTFPLKLSGTDKFNFQRAPSSKGRSQMQEAMISDTEAVVRDFLFQFCNKDTPESKLVIAATIERVQKLISKEMGLDEYDEALNPRALKACLLDNGASYLGQLRAGQTGRRLRALKLCSWINDNKARIYVKNNER